MAQSGPAPVCVTAPGNELPIRVLVSQPGTVTGTCPVALSVILGLRVHTLRHVPGVLQDQLKRVFSATIQLYVATPNESTLFGLLAFPKLVLRAVQVKGKQAQTQVVEKVRARLSAFQNGDWQTLWAAVQSEMVDPRCWLRHGRKNEPE